MTSGDGATPRTWGTWCPNCRNDPCLYPVWAIDIPSLHYRWEAPIFASLPGTTDILARFRERENRMGGFPQPPDPAWARTEPGFLAVVNHMSRHGIVNPLVVKQAGYGLDFDGGCFYVVVGNQRLCALRIFIGSGWAVSQQIPCMIAHEGDSWDDLTRALKLHPAPPINLHSP